MATHFEGELVKLKDLVLQMGGLVEASVELAIKQLSQHQPNEKEKVDQFEEETNQLHIKIDDTCLKILARKSPVAGDLRFILAVTKINADLERMGDHALNFYRTTQKLDTMGAESVTNGLLAMAKIVKTMMKDSLDAFVSNNPTLAYTVLAHDKTVNVMRDTAYQLILAHLSQNGTAAKQMINLNIVARILERLGDHAKNIAEDVIFIATGKDVRHIKQG